ncbi:hypothetical protein HDE_04931 [Halotydeus destructor]|nr:hypothetical protein HDE_04931 [Halotydeus destructor]
MHSIPTLTMVNRFTLLALLLLTLDSVQPEFRKSAKQKTEECVKTVNNYHWHILVNCGFCFIDTEKNQKVTQKDADEADKRCEIGCQLLKGNKPFGMCKGFRINGDGQDFCDCKWQNFTELERAPKRFSPELA